MRRIWDRHKSMTLWQHTMPSAAKMTPIRRTRFWRYRFANVPMVWWTVLGRKEFETKRSLAIRVMWRVGNYPIGRK